MNAEYLRIKADMMDAMAAVFRSNCTGPMRYVIAHHANELRFEAIKTRRLYTHPITLPDLMKRPDGNLDPLSDCRRLRLHNEAKQRRVAFWERLTACLRGFTHHSLRPVSFRWQARFKDWRSAYVEAEKQLTLARSC